MTNKSWNLERDWMHRLYFDAYFEDALSKMKAATGLGTTYALFIALNQYFYDNGYMDEKGYHYHVQRYSKPLVDEFETHLATQQEEVSLAIQRKEREIAGMKKQLVNALDNWHLMKPKAQQYYREKAELNKEWEIAQKILAKEEPS